MVLSKYLDLFASFRAIINDHLRTNQILPAPHLDYTLGLFSLSSVVICMEDIYSEETNEKVFRALIDRILISGHSKLSSTIVDDVYFKKYYINLPSSVYPLISNNKDWFTRERNLFTNNLVLTSQQLVIEQEKLQDYYLNHYGELGITPILTTNVLSILLLGFLPATIEDPQLKKAIGQFLIVKHSEFKYLQLMMNLKQKYSSTI